MKTIIILIALALTCLSCTTTPAKWTKAETTKEVVWLIFHAVDYKQTRYAMDRPDEFKEMNPALGEHPSKGRLNTFALVGALCHVAGTHWIEKKYRGWWQNITIGMKILTVGNNISVGAKIKW